MANLIVGPTTAYLMADAGQYHSDGTLISTAPKIATAPHLNAAVTTSGAATADTHRIIAEWLACRSRMSELLRDLPELLDILLAELDTVPPADRGDIPRFVQMFVAHWSYRHGRAEGYIVGSHQGTFGPSYRPRTVCGVDRVISPPTPLDIDPLHFDPSADALSLAQAQRQAAGERGIFLVGGEVQIAEVSHSGISVRQVCAWPDRIGEKIDPARSNGGVHGH